uniref:Transmembrane protein 8B n=1 Tax=Salmo trutta TaxID=8032 RepID=A0A673XG44_SALTR
MYYFWPERVDVVSLSPPWPGLLIWMVGQGVEWIESRGYCHFVTDYFTRTPRKLNAFRSFASVELFHFSVPEDTVVAVWNLITFKEQGGTFGDSCPDRNVTVYFRSGAPPVINPLHTRFPQDTIVPGSFAVTLTWTLPNRTTGVFNVTSPLPGDWFLAAHLPKDEGKISVKGLYEECQYLFQPQLIVQRLIGISVLYPGYFIEQMVPAHNRSVLYKVFIPSYVSSVKVQLANCNTRAPPVHNSSALDCREWSPCELDTPLPAWEHWYYILVERYLSNQDVYFRIGVQVTGRHSSSGPSSNLNLPQSFGSAMGFSLSETCWPIRPTLRNELDTFSVHFYIFFGPNISVPPDKAAVFSINLMPVLDSGGVLNMELKLNLSSLRGENITVFGCLNHGMPLSLKDNSSVKCESGRRSCCFDRTYCKDNRYLCIQVLYLLGAMTLSMALQLDRHGLWNLLGPSLFALGIMAVAWTVRTVRRRRCYPPTWKRWAFFLFPGTMIAVSAVALYAFVETEDNYFYIHSIWHMLIAGSVGFLLPPRAKPRAKLTPLKRRRGCGYQLCVNEHEEMGLVDPVPAIVAINSISIS